MVKGAHFAPFTTQERQLRLVLTDHHASLNNCAFFLRAGAWARRAFLPLWAHLSQSRTIDWPMTDNGVLLEVLLRLFAKGYGPMSCNPNLNGPGAS